MKDRIILHIDMNAFYASVEALSHPEVAGKPMAVAGDPENRRGIILAKNELAKQYGVKTAETIWSAERKCPGLILLPPHHDLYEEYCVKANAIYERYTDLVEQAGIDESYLDVTGSAHLFGGGAAIADSIRAAVKAELGLTVSAGVSFCKLFAKMGSDLRKPDYTNIIDREAYQAILYPMPVTDLMYVGRATARSLADIGVHTIGQLAAIDRAILANRLGKHGHVLYTYVHGLDEEQVRRTADIDEMKSIGNSMTYRRNLTTPNDVTLGLRMLSESVAYRLRKHGRKCCGVQIAIKDPEFKIIDRQKQLEQPTHLTKPIYEAALELALRAWKAGDPIRLLSVTAVNLVEEDQGGQLSLFGEVRDDSRQEALEQSKDKLRGRYGKMVIKPASALGNDIGIRE